jgi:hypothetical protein
MHLKKEGLLAPEYVLEKEKKKKSIRGATKKRRND